MANSSSFRGRLKRYRQERGWTQDDLAERVGCATQTIRKIEGGQRRPSYQMAARLAQVLQLPADEHAAWMAEVHETAEQESTASESVATTASAHAPGLPVYLTPFVGREQEQANLARLLESPDCRLITLLGPGGIGKTRLAVEVARQVAGFPDGVAFVALAPVAAPQAIVPTIADALGFNFSGPSDLASQLLAYLRDKRILLVLDNLEHLLDSGNRTLGFIEQLLAHASGLTVLVTSRERLKLPAAWVFEIEGLPVPPARAVSPSSEYPSLTLFTEHAQRVEQVPLGCKELHCRRYDLPACWRHAVGDRISCGLGAHALTRGN